MIEVVVCIVLVGVLMVAALNTAAAAVDLRERAVDRVRAQGLADEMLAEILSRQYAVSTTNYASSIGKSPAEAGQPWGMWNDVDDFNDLVMTPPRDGDGNIIPGFANITLRCEVRHMNETTLARIASTASSAATRLKLIVVTVERAGRPLAQSVAVRSWGFDQAGGLR